MPRLVKPSATIVTATPHMLDVIEDAARLCYLSEPKTGLPEDSKDGAMWVDAVLKRKQEQAKFLLDKIALGHHSVLEHGYVTVDFTCDRGVSHEEVRHRLQAISQESQRYCNYSKDKFGSEIAVIEPCYFPQDDESYKVFTPAIEGLALSQDYMTKFDLWFMAMQFSEWAYLNLLGMGASPQQACGVLPRDCKTQLRCSANIREWRHILKIRTEAGVHPKMAEIMVPLLQKFKEQWLILFEDINHHPKWDLFL